jgi:hypothetical protein
VATQMTKLGGLLQLKKRNDEMLKGCGCEIGKQPFFDSCKIECPSPGFKPTALKVSRNRFVEIYRRPSTAQRQQRAIEGGALTSSNSLIMRPQ